MQTPGASGIATPDQRFVSENKDVEDRLKAQTVGLVQASDFRKRTAEAMAGSNSSDTKKPSPNAEAKRKTKRKAPKGGLSFAADDDEEDDASDQNLSSRLKPTPQDTSPTDNDRPVKRRLPANPAGAYQAKSMTKSSLAKEAETKARLRAEFLATQAAVRATEFILPFSFYDGALTDGGTCRVRKGDQVWLFLDRARKAGAAEGKSSSRASWARISVDDLLLVRDDLIIPHNYEFYYFMLNESVGREQRLFPHTARRTAASPEQGVVDDPEDQGGLTLHNGLQTRKPSSKAQVFESGLPDSELEGYGDDPQLTKVVDRRWYEKNKHIYPASTWETFDPEVDYKSSIRKDGMGNIIFRG